MSPFPVPKPKPEGSTDFDGIVMVLYFLTVVLGIPLIVWMLKAGF
jgi:hypothetical protein